MCHYPGADCHQSSTIPPWPMCVTIQGQTATSHQPFHPGLCVSLSRGRLPPVINHSILAYVCHYPGADCHQSSTIPSWPMCVTIQGQTATSHQPSGGSSAIQQEGFSQTLRPKSPCGYLSGVAIFPVNMVYNTNNVR